ncbi:coiled-coil domain-containing protein 103 [Homalodisca vitripennis]|uniref:Dynein attachment factor N-terminal domain-containing protein n=2 Tax=Homalodisca liturata TaxID=320908 RepID=A0A1B6IWA4_9HEMI|nr:coiled-coil domain-containing protein 103 [Homalodisca vitripennis]XP_046670684.1 coiled-coil domain-containing protein 103 [Homalodisca vitripennis]XP_046670692.1 coiled-coil domain-containing protein 103 [Homalodisca vitripennis]XP_046670701.1 coiled-coil domain-containing protein 103 [Homalodisca vitripennis]XP_046670711.1 coiled-coil domain-containing protein 103 [Homalodisca vitripennis]
MSNISEVDFKELEKELKESIKEDKKYWRENDAKLRAVNQNVSTYEEFRDMVKAAHLKPLEKSERLGADNRQKGCIWNSFVDRKPDLPPLKNMEIENVLNDIRNDDESVTGFRYVRKFSLLRTNEERYKLLMKTGTEELGNIFKTEIPTGVLGRIVEALLCFMPAVNEIIFVTQVLEILSKTKRFTITLDFLTREEKDFCSKLMGKLDESLKDNQQDLAEQGVTEWTITTLRSKYKV